MASAILKIPRYLTVVPYFCGNMRQLPRPAIPFHNPHRDSHLLKGNNFTLTAAHRSIHILHLDKPLHKASRSATLVKRAYHRSEQLRTVHANQNPHKTIIMARQDRATLMHATYFDVQPSGKCNYIHLSLLISS